MKRPKDMNRKDLIKLVKKLKDKNRGLKVSRSTRCKALAREIENGGEILATFDALEEKIEKLKVENIELENDRDFWKNQADAYLEELWKLTPAPPENIETIAQYEKAQNELKEIA